MIKLFLSNLKDKGTTGSAIMIIAAWVLNTYFGYIPKDVADAILLIFGSFVLAFFAKKGTLPVK